MIGGDKLKQVHSEINTLSLWIKNNERLVLSHMNDFIVNDLRKLLPKNEDATMEFQKTCKEFGKIDCCIDGKYGVCHELCLNNEQSKENCFNALEENDKKKQNTFLSIKKNHEIVVMSSKIAVLCKNIECKDVVDVGSGKGYLGQCLSDDYDMNVLGIEGCHDYSVSALNRQQTFEKIKKYSASNFRTINFEINKESLDDSKNLINTIKENMENMNQVSNKTVLIGLHACGDLTSNSLQLFSQESYFKAILIVGCCYNLCANDGFPLSVYLKSKDLDISKNMLMLACQSPEKWKLTNQELGQSLLFRSIFQKLVSDKGIGDDFVSNIKFRKIGKKAKSFQDYLGLALKDLPKDISTKLMENAMEYYSCYKDLWSEMKKFHWLRMQLAPCIEKLILLDRVCYLMENGYQNASAVRLFEASLSPRCFAVICNKKD